MKILVLQHARVEHPGSLRNYLSEDGHSWTAVELDEGEPLPDIKFFDALWVLGGPMDVWQEDIHPWLVEEKAYIRHAVKDLGMPFLGLCLGHQLLAEALGGRCGKAEIPEIGIMPVTVTEEGASSIFLDGLPGEFNCLQWHGAEVVTMPTGASCLVTSPACSIQAMSWYNRAFSVQFHVEVESDTVSNWAKIPEYRDALHAELGPNGSTRLEHDCSVSMAEMETMAERMYINWLHAASGA